MKRYGMVMMLWMVSLSCTASMATAEEAPPPRTELQASSSQEVIVQIGGRFCEYRRSEVEGALRRFDAVQQVEFLNQHGTVLVRYQPDTVSSSQLAESVERALAMGWNCKAWVDRGQR
jgi:copper chaperone CopZ